MNWLTDVSWVAGPALQVILLSFMVQRKLQGVFPRFFSYILFQILKSGVLFVAYHYFEDSYFNVYWTGNAISVLLAVTVMEEILDHLFKRYSGIENLGTTIFRWGCGLLLLLFFLGAPSGHGERADRGRAPGMGFETR